MRHLERDDAAHTGAEKIVGTGRLNITHLFEKCRRDVLDARQWLLHAVEAARLQTIERPVGSYEPRKVVVAQHVAADAGHTEERRSTPPSLNRNQAAPGP